MDKRGFLLDRIISLKNSCLEKHTRSFLTSVLYWEELRSLQFEGIHDVYNLIQTLNRKVNPLEVFIARYKIVSQVGLLDPNDGSNDNITQRSVGAVCTKVLSSADELLLEGLNKLITGYEQEIFTLSQHLETNICPIYTLLWTNAVEIMSYVSKAEIRVKHLTEKCIGVIEKYSDKDNLVDNNSLLLSSASIEHEHNLWLLVFQCYIASMRFELTLYYCNVKLSQLYKLCNELEAFRQNLLIQSTGISLYSI